MKEVDKKVLREAAVNCKHAGETPFMPFDQRMAAFDEFKRLFTPNVQLALLDELEAAESKCRELAAVVAENAALKTAAKETLAHWAAAEAGEMELMMDKCMPVLRDAYCETPATDAFLAEVRAQGVDAAIEHLNKKFAGTGHIGVPVMSLEWLAQELRKGAEL